MKCVNQENIGKRHRTYIKLGQPNISIQMNTLDYYMDGDFLVFTSEYLLRRGTCCGNGCRHCPYRKLTSPEPLQQVVETKQLVNQKCNRTGCKD